MARLRSETMKEGGKIYFQNRKEWHNKGQTARNISLEEAELSCAVLMSTSPLLATRISSCQSCKKHAKPGVFRRLIDRSFFQGIWRSSVYVRRTIVP